jgi:hypothetical protein
MLLLYGLIIGTPQCPNIRLHHLSDHPHLFFQEVTHCPRTLQPLHLAGRSLFLLQHPTSTTQRPVILTSPASHHGLETGTIPVPETMMTDLSSCRGALNRITLILATPLAKLPQPSDILMIYRNVQTCLTPMPLTRTLIRILMENLYHGVPPTRIHLLTMATPQ